MAVLAEQFHGWGVMGLPFASGHYLALRDFAQSSVGPAYRSVWHRDPEGRWVVYADADPAVSCARYFGTCLARAQTAAIEVTWTGESTFTVTVPELLTWHVKVGRDVATILMSAMGRVLPDRWWRSDGVLTAMGPAAGLMLGVGRVGLRGTVPNGQRFQAAPFRIRRVRDSHAVIGGVDVGPPGPLPVQERLGDFWLPQRGMVAEGRSSFEALDPQRHSTATSR